MKEFEQPLRRDGCAYEPCASHPLRGARAFSQVEAHDVHVDTDEIQPAVHGVHGDGDEWMSHDHQIMTTSRFHVWWLTRFKGFRIVETSRRPKLSLFGMTSYVSTWRLVTLPGKSEHAVKISSEMR